MTLTLITRSKNIDKVKDPLPIPETCRCCGGAVELVLNSEIYGKTYGVWPYAYLCQNKDCGAYVGLHPHTAIPLGTLADKPTREARKEAKKPFIEWVEKYKIPRSVAYASLAEAMGIPKAECHFGWFTVEQCQQAKEALSNLIKYRGYKWMGTK